MKQNITIDPKLKKYAIELSNTALKLDTYYRAFMAFYRDLPAGYKGEAFVEFNNYSANQLNQLKLLSENYERLAMHLVRVVNEHLALDAALAQQMSLDLETYLRAARFEGEREDDA